MKRIVSLGFLIVTSLSASDTHVSERSKLLYNSVPEICLFWAVGLDLELYNTYHHMMTQQCNVIKASHHMYQHKNDATLTCTDMLKYLAGQCCLNEKDSSGQFNCLALKNKSIIDHDTKAIDESLNLLAKKLE